MLLSLPKRRILELANPIGFHRSGADLFRFSPGSGAPSRNSSSASLYQETMEIALVELGKMSLNQIAVDLDCLMSKQTSQELLPKVFIFASLDTIFEDDLFLRW